MKKAFDIYENEARLLHQTGQISSAAISERNKEIITEFKDFLTRDNISTSRTLRYIILLKTIAKFMNKNFDELTKKDVEKFAFYLSSLRGAVQDLPTI